MKNPNTALNKALKKTLNFIMKLESDSIPRIPEWYDQIVSNANNRNLDNNLRDKLMGRLNKTLKTEYGNSVASFLLS